MQGQNQPAKPTPRGDFIRQLTAQLDAQFAEKLPHDLGSMAEPDKAKAATDIHSKSIELLLDSMGLDPNSRSMMLELHKRRQRASEILVRVHSRKLIKVGLAVDPTEVRQFLQDFKDGLRQVVESGEKFEIGFDAEGRPMTAQELFAEANAAQRRIDSGKARDVINAEYLQPFLQVAMKINDWQTAEILKDISPEYNERRRILLAEFDRRLTSHPDYLKWNPRKGSL